MQTHAPRSWGRAANDGLWSAAIHCRFPHITLFPRHAGQSRPKGESGNEWPHSKGQANLQVAKKQSGAPRGSVNNHKIEENEDQTRKSRGAWYTNCPPQELENLRIVDQRAGPHGRKRRRRRPSRFRRFHNLVPKNVPRHPFGRSNRRQRQGQQRPNLEELETWCPK
jgi:hypothetical protein